MIDSRYISIQQGLILPDEEACNCGHKDCGHKAVVLQEMDLSWKKHRWKEVNKIQSEMFDAFMKLTTKHETEILKILNLPSIEVVRTAYNQKSADQFEYNDYMGDSLDPIYKEWTDDIVGDNGTYPFYMLSLFAAGLARIYKQMLDSAPNYMIPFIRENNIMPSPSNPYLYHITNIGGKRIKTALAKEFMTTVKKELANMARQGLSPIEVARRLHRITGEGKAWYWLRLVRTESTLALGSAFDAMAEAEQCLYEEWSAGANACYGCAALDGQVWLVHQGPFPAEDTHPSCNCNREGLWTTDKKVNPQWTRESPYDRRWTPEEVEGWF